MKLTQDEFKQAIIESEASLGVVEKLLETQYYDGINDFALKESIYIESRERINLIIDTLGYIQDTKVDNNSYLEIKNKISSVHYFIDSSKNRFGRFLVE